jgi:hypothetical protein
MRGEAAANEISAGALGKMLGSKEDPEFFLKLPCNFEDDDDDPDNQPELIGYSSGPLVTVVLPATSVADMTSDKRLVSGLRPTRLGQGSRRQSARSVSLHPPSHFSVMRMMHRTPLEKSRRRRVDGAGF